MKFKVKNKIFFTILVTLIVIVLLFPVYWQFIISIRSSAQLNSSDMSLLPKGIHLENYIYIFSQTKFLNYILNSFIVSMATTIISLVIGLFCAYAVARLNIKGKNFILAFVLSVSIFPGIALVSPLFVIFKKLSLLNTYWGLILPYITFALPLAIWNLQAFFKEIPKEVDESAKIDGASPFTIFLKIIMPLVTPGIFTTFIMIFITSWNEFLFGLIFATNGNMRTVPVGIIMLQGEYNVPWGQISAASIIITVPVIVMVMIFQRRIISGITSGAVKS
ncbi:carbohydrate ABC transporter permease [Clostridium sp.]|jgi:multiple sugar transport system permease protein|uniref:carbohydrate ABC transporter permease n=1 Tax=Clostridium sp. TaxID=1506 RepID=UPI0025836175|nr:carbohydrate ABC transporter permease [Clostridium sp.]MDF2504719.1 ABC-type sugar transport system, permease component [Clostridium sp.]